jgi:hypothetical protein
MVKGGTGYQKKLKGGARYQVTDRVTQCPLLSPFSKGRTASGAR